MKFSPVRFGHEKLPVAGLLLLVSVSQGYSADDPVDRLVRSGAIPPEAIKEYGYSDYTDPLGRFLDYLAAGAVAKAKALRPEACATWKAKRTQSPFTGKFRVFNTDVELDQLCGG